MKPEKEETTNGAGTAAVFAAGTGVFALAVLNIVANPRSGI